MSDNGSNNGSSPLATRPVGGRRASSASPRPDGSASPSSPRQGTLGDIPDSVRRMRDMPASQRIKMEWEAKQKRMHEDSGRKSVRDRRSPSPQCSRRNEIDEEVSQRRLGRIKGTESAPRSDFDPTIHGDSSVWARNRQERFTYQYGNFEGAIPVYVPSKKMLNRSPAVGTYGKSTSIDA